MVEAGVPLREAVEMASTTPARIAGVADRRGSIAPGMDADITVLDRDLSVMLAMVGGRIVYGSEAQ
jgi:N-acetylglucosamine-6-phosphate deacetylase